MRKAGEARGAVRIRGATAARCYLVLAEKRILVTNLTGCAVTVVRALTAVPHAAHEALLDDLQEPVFRKHDTQGHRGVRTTRGIGALAHLRARRAHEAGTAWVPRHAWLANLAGRL